MHNYSSIVSNILVKCISEIDNRITEDLLKLFPGGIEEISKMTDNEVKQRLKGPNSQSNSSCVEAFRARTGTTALVVLLDPHSFLHVSSLGDCDASESFGYSVISRWK